MGSKQETTMKVLLLLLSLGLAPRSLPCTYGPCDCRLPGTILNWHNGEPIGTRNNVDETGCRDACENTQDCAAWTLNTQNGWCALKAEDQIKKGANSGFVSEIMVGYHDCPFIPY